MSEAVPATNPLARGERRLRIMAQETGHPANDLLDWYKYDIAEIGRESAENARALINDYISRWRIYRQPAIQTA